MLNNKETYKIDGMTCASCAKAVERVTKKLDGVERSSVNIMSDRGKNFSIIGTLPQGTKVKVIDTKFDWHKIEYNGRYGYVSGVYVK